MCLVAWGNLVVILGCAYFVGDTQGGLGVKMTLLEPEVKSSNRGSPAGASDCHLIMGVAGCGHLPSFDQDT